MITKYICNLQWHFIIDDIVVVAVFFNYRSPLLRAKSRIWSSHRGRSVPCQTWLCLLVLWQPQEKREKSMATPRHQPLYIAGRQWLLGNNTSIISAKTRDFRTAVTDNMIVANLYPMFVSLWVCPGYGLLLAFRWVEIFWLHLFNRRYLVMDCQFNRVSSKIPPTETAHFSRQNKGAGWFSQNVARSVTNFGRHYVKPGSSLFHVLT